MGWQVMKAEKRRDADVLGLAGKLAALMVLALLLAGCPDSDKSTEFPFDERELTNPIQNRNTDVYSGNVMNGNLENAIVWLDMDGNGRLSPDEPWGWSDENGEFKLDVSKLKQQNRADGRDLDPRDFPLMAVAVPEYTIDRHVNEEIDHAFFLMAPPGRTLISPFSTMVEARRRLPFVPAVTSPGNALERSATDVRARMAVASEEVSVLQNYRRSQAPRTPFYAEALRRFIQAQVPGGISGGISNGTDNPQVNAFVREDIQVIGTLMLDQIGDILEEVDALIDAYKASNNDDALLGFTLPVDSLETIVDLKPDLSNPFVLREQIVYLPPAEEDNLTLDASNVDSRGRVVARVLFDYGVGTALRRIDVLGESAPSMSVIAMLMDDGGRVADLGRQPWFDVVLDEDNIDRADSDVLERFIGNDGQPIRWNQFEVGLDSSIIAHSPVAELDGLLDRLYEIADGAPVSPVTGLDRTLPHHGDDTDATLQITFAGDGREQPVNIPQAFAGAADLSVSFGPVQYLNDHDGTCDAPTVDSLLVVNARQSVTISSADIDLEGELTRYGRLRDESGDKVQAFRVLLEEFVPSSGDAGNTLNERREFEYFDDSGSVKAETQPDLLRSVRIFLGKNASNSNRFCDNTGNTGGDSDNSGGKARMLENSDLDVYIGFEYLPFTDYLEQQGSVN